jgi:hypothetical protein
MDYFDANYEELEQERLSQRRKLLGALGGILLSANERKPRVANAQRSREDVEGRIRRLSDKEFARQYGLERPRFDAVLEKIEPLIERSESGKRMAKLSSGSAVSPYVQLAIALRVARGGSYLDISFAYCVAGVTVYDIFYRVFAAIDKSYDNIKFSFDVDELEHLRSTFDKYGGDMYVPNVVAVGDGVVFRMKKPTPKDTGNFVTGYYTRKGYYAYGMQAFCDGNKKFVFIASEACSATHDSTHYAMTSLFAAIRRGDLPEPYCVLLDAAYVCTKQELTPWKGKSLSDAKDAFNYYLALKRQCIEGAFGLLTRCWGILWRPLQMNFAHIKLVLRVLCKLHNMRVDDFLARNANGAMTTRDVPYLQDNVLWRRGSQKRAADVRDVPLYDARPLKKGRRTDLEATSPTRLQLTNTLESLGVMRPKGSAKDSKIRRGKF